MSKQNPNPKFEYSVQDQANCFAVEFAFPPPKHRMPPTFSIHRLEMVARGTDPFNNPNPGFWGSPTSTLDW